MRGTRSSIFDMSYKSIFRLSTLLSFNYLMFLTFIAGAGLKGQNDIKIDKSNLNISYGDNKVIEDDSPFEVVTATTTISSTIATNGDEVLIEIYEECILNLSFVCLRRKIVRLLNRLRQTNRINLIGDYVTIIKKSVPVDDRTDDYDAEDTVEQSPSIILATESGEQNGDWKNVINDLTNRILRDRIVRIEIPSFLESYLNKDGDNRQRRTIIDVNFGRDDLRNSDNNTKGRKKKMKKKHLLALLGLKMSLMGPLIIAMICMKALKALILSTISLTISKILLMQKSQTSSSHASTSGHGHSHSGSGHGWDRTLQESGTLPYFTYPPTPTSHDNYSGATYY